ncbi:MAG: acyl-ACP--UDP-N-acetylglucosamine O-acyltransferase [Candidatus Aminicenantes bacterium]|nr:acyl-ACP--UDP-N-acetylglucosamine O-acyltransferase [Candidatus Aminicenantes bacterium]
MSGEDAVVHPTAVVEPGARLAGGVRVGPGCVIGARVAVGPNTIFEANVFVGGWTTIGADNRFSPGVVLGTEPQDVGYKGEPTRIVIGDRNIFREYVTVHRATAKEEGLTRIGDDNYFMAFSHVAHDCRIGDKTIFLHGGTLGGHVRVADGAVVGAMSAVHQFCRLGRLAFMGGGSMIVQDVIPFARVAGQRPTRLLGLNVVGLRRNGYSRERIAALKEMFRLLFFADLNTAQALARIEAEIPPSEDREELVSFVRTSKRGIVKKAGSWDGDSE